MLSDDAKEKIDRECLKYPHDPKRSAIMSALRIAQNEHGWLSKDLIEHVANYLGIAPTMALEVATFYSMYNTTPVGKYKLTICTNLPCALSGATDITEYLQAKLGIGFNETTADGLFTLMQGECMGACGLAPVMLLNNHKMCPHMTKEQIDVKLNELSLIK